MYRVNEGTLSHFPESDLVESDTTRRRPSQLIFWLPYVVALSALLTALFFASLSLLEANGTVLPGLNDTPGTDSLQVINYGPPAGLLALLTGLLMALCGFLFSNFLYWHVTDSRSRYAELGCPQCGEHDLIRTRRSASDRFLNSLKMPVIRYTCRYCSWQGRRFGILATAPYSYEAWNVIFPLPRANGTQKSGTETVTMQAAAPTLDSKNGTGKTVSEVSARSPNGQAAVIPQRDKQSKGTKVAKGRTEPSEPASSELIDQNDVLVRQVLAKQKQAASFNLQQKPFAKSADVLQADAGPGRNGIDGDALPIEGVQSDIEHTWVEARPIDDLPPVDFAVDPQEFERLIQSALKKVTSHDADAVEGILIPMHN